MPAVKANAYGHGAVEVARTVLAAGADALGVARIDEAVSLRQAGIEAPLLIFGYTAPEETRRLLEFDITATVNTYDTAAALSRAARLAGGRVRIHIKVDTGMGRLGLPVVEPQQTVKTIGHIARLSGLDWEGIFTHFATADSADKTFARKQFTRFVDLLQQLEQAGLQARLRHCANSAAIVDLPATHLDLVRPGIAVYGLKPSEEIDLTRIALRPAMTLKTRIVHLKQVGAGFPVSYGATHITPRPARIATLAIGYADGFNRRLSSRGWVLVHGRRAPVVGRVCMDLTMVDVSRVADAGRGDEVVVFGSQQEAVLSAEELAATLETINYEITSAVTARVPRIYK
jgi:alanine racemase